MVDFKPPMANNNKKNVKGCDICTYTFEETERTQ
jgi:hypothetical protein